MSARRLRARYAGSCAACGAAVAAGGNAWWDPGQKRLTCLGCGPTDVPSPPIDEPHGPIAAGQAGGSAQREYDRRSTKRQEDTMAAHPRIGKLLLAVREEPNHVTAWEKGAEGERQIGRKLDRLTSEGCVVLHDRLIPGSKANIDHMVVGPSGLWIVDAKNYSGRPQRQNRGSWRTPDVRLYVGRRDCTRLLDQMGRQVAAVGNALGPDLLGDVNVRPTLCFYAAEWGLLDGPFKVDGIFVSGPRRLLKEIQSSGPMSPQVVVAVAERLNEVLVPA